jgi:hypothetical protein
MLQYNMMSRLAKKGQAVEDATRFFGNELRDARPAVLVYHNQCCGSGAFSNPLGPLTVPAASGRCRPSRIPSTYFSPAQ